MRLRIAHSTTYRYEPPATGVIQIIRMTPRSYDGQYVADWQVFVSTDSRMQMHQDAYGNITHVLTHGAIADLTINVEGLVETHDTSGVLKGTDERFPPDFFLRSTALTEVSAEMRAFAHDLRPVSDDDTLGFLHGFMQPVLKDVMMPTYRVTFSPASIVFTAAIAASSLSASRERTTMLVLGLLFSSRNG